MAEPHDSAVGQDLAVLARVSRQTPALEVVLLVHAEAVVHAGRRVALVDLHRAVLAREARLAGADKIIDVVVTGSPVLARVRDAVIDVLFAVCAHESGVAVALVIGDKVDAGSPVSARIGRTVVDVDVAVLPCEPLWTPTHVIGPVLNQRASRTVVTRRGPAGVDLHVAVHTLVAVRTLANISGDAALAVETPGTILAGHVVAGLGHHLAMAAVEPQWTNASIIVQTSTLMRRKK